MTTDPATATDPAARIGTTIELDGAPVYYETEGTGEALVLLHGGMATNGTWGAQFAGFVPTRRVIAPERQAHGHTPDQPGPITYQGMADQTVAFLRALDLGPADLVGWSDGGMIGLLIAADHPELVRSLTLVGSGFSSDGYVPGCMDEFCGLPADDPEMAMLAAMYAEVSPDGADHFAAVWEKVRTMWAEPFDWSDRLERITAPVLVVVGDDDYITIPHADQLARRVADGRLAVVPGASHLSPMEKPRLFNQLVLDFLDQPEVETWMPLRRKPATPSA
jgi:pimeloyl-ACP methyl ester carboxylesterase